MDEAFAKEQCFQFGVKELWRDGKGRGLSSFVDGSDIFLSMLTGVCSREGDSYGNEAIGKFN